VVAFLQHVEDENFRDELPTLAGGREARDAIQAYLGSGSWSLAAAPVAWLAAGSEVVALAR